MNKYFSLLSGFLLIYNIQVNSQVPKLNEHGYFDSPAMSVLMFHNIYPVGKQGGIEIIQYNNRIATNGNVHFERVQPKVNDGPHVPIPPSITRKER